MPKIRPRRSHLYMPGANPRVVAKGRALPCDGVILDLEDSIAPDNKSSAREAAAAEVAAGGFGHREVVLRINGPDTPWFADDLKAAAAAAPDAILITKVASPETVIEAGRTLDRLGAPERVKLWAMMETPLAIFRAEAIAATVRRPEGRRLGALVAGTNDLAKEVLQRLEPDREAMLPYLALFIAAARAHGLAVLDGVHNGFGDPEAFEAECRQGRRIGFDGKTLIHPSQIEAANRIFSPSPEELAQAKAILEAFARPENADKGAIALNGQMVERLHAEIAARIVATAGEEI